jgi:hypothetical protein
MKTTKFELSISDRYLQPKIHQRKVYNIIKRELNEKIHCYNLEFLFSSNIPILLP